MKQILIIIFVCIAGLAFAQLYSDYQLDDFLTKQEQKDIGIKKLSIIEKEKLRIVIIEKFLLGYEQGKKDGLEQAVKSIIPQQSSSNIIESQINGDFEGWEGETIVKLMNGQIWQQSDYYYQYHYAFMPKVLIYKSYGSYKMKVDGISKAVGVRLLR